MKRSLPIGQVAAVVAGNALGFYDYLTYGFFAVYISSAFFPSDNPSTSLLLTLGVFFIGFFARPVGAVVLGTMGDRVGRKPALILSFSLMGIGVLGLALTPNYASIGIAAPILVLLFRIIQGFALGGEVGPTTAYMLEAAPPERRGLYASFQATTQDFAVLCAGLVGFALASFLSTAQLQSWGWRVAFLIGGSIIPFVLVARRNLEETFSLADTPDEPVAFRPHLRIAVLGLAIIGSGTILSYTLNYMTTYAMDTLHMAASVAFAATIVNGASGVLFDSVSGWLSDRYGRKPVMIIPGALLVLACMPVFLAIVHFQSATAFLVGVGVIAVLGAFSQPPVLIALTEALPRAIRSRGLSTVYALAIATFGGGTPLLVKWLLTQVGNPLVPAWLLTPVSAIGVIAMLLFPETAPVKTGRRDDI
jgi:MFS family permease